VLRLTGAEEEQGMEGDERTGQKLIKRRTHWNRVLFYWRRGHTDVCRAASGQCVL